MNLLSDPGDRTPALAAITDDTSAVLPASIEGISLAELQGTTDRLFESDTEVHDPNAVRKYVSTLKGGGPARFVAPTTAVGLVLSDVVGNDLGVITSGLIVSDETTYDDTLSVLDRFDPDVPKPVRTRLACGPAGDVPEMPKPDDPVFDRMTNRVLADTFTVLDTVRKVANDRRCEPSILFSRVCDEACGATKTHVVVAEGLLATESPITASVVVLSGDGCTVTVHGDGDGGPNLEFCLAATAELPDETVLASVNSDGKDDGTEVVGVAADTPLVAAGDAHTALVRDDTLPVLREAGVLVRSGATGMNVSDLRILVVSEGV